MTGYPVSVQYQVSTTVVTGFYYWDLGNPRLGGTVATPTRDCKVY
jgi:hypothetical protein